MQRLEPFFSFETQYIRERHMHTQACIPKRTNTLKGVWQCSLEQLRHYNHTLYHLISDFGDDQTKITSALTQRVGAKGLFDRASLPNS